MSYTITVRLSDEARARLDEEAERLGLPPGTLAAQLIGDGLDDPPARPDEGDGEGGPLVETVLAAFAGHQGAQTAVAREVCLSLARQVERGGAGATAAGARVLAMMREALPRPSASEDELRRAMAVLSRPVFTECPGCGWRGPKVVA